MLISLSTDISRKRNVESVTWLLLFFMQIYSVKQQQVGAKRIIKHAVWGGKEQKDCNC